MRSLIRNRPKSEFQRQDSLSLCANEDPAKNSFNSKQLQLKFDWVIDFEPVYNEPNAQKIKSMVPHCSVLYSRRPRRQ